MAKIEKNNNVNNVITTLKELNGVNAIKCGKDVIEFPDGSKETFFYNGEEDRQAAITFANICVQTTSDTAKAKKMMFTCFQLMINGIKPERIIKLSNGTEVYLDPKKKAAYTGTGSEFVTLTDDEKKKKLNIDALELILKERAENKLLEIEAAWEYDDEDINDEWEEWLNQ